MRDLRETTGLKNNVLPFPSLQAAPRDPPRPSAWRALGAFVLIVACVGLFMLTIYALCQI